jgi:hypothetical protein
VLRVAEAMLASKVSAARNDRKSALDFLKRAASLEDALMYGEPPDWFIPARESLGGLLLNSKYYAEAELVFREDLKHHPASGRSLFGLYRSLKSQGKESGASEVYKQYQNAWTRADTMLRIEDL